MKKHIKLLLRTLFSNNACVEAARTKETKYNVIAVIFAIFALFFAALPTCVTGFQKQGGAWLRGSLNYSFDTAMVQFREHAKEDQDKPVSFEINDKHELIAHNWEESIATYNWDGRAFDNLHCSISTHLNSEGDVTEEHKILEVYYCPDVENFSLFVEEVANNINPVSAINDIKVNKEKKKVVEAKEEYWLEGYTEDKKGKHVRNARCTSFIVFGKKQIQGALYPPGTAAVASSSLGGDYKSIKPVNDLITEVLVKSPDPSETIVSDCAKFFDKTYVNVRAATTWRSTGIFIAVDTGVIILMGFMVWILTRGKNNPFRIYSVWDGQKIAYYASLTPGILGLFGFLISNMAMMLFILGAGVRIMWLSMRTLRYQAPAKQ